MKTLALKSTSLKSFLCMEKTPKPIMCKLSNDVYREVS